MTEPKRWTVYTCPDGHIRLQHRYGCGLACDNYLNATEVVAAADFDRLRDERDRLMGEVDRCFQRHADECDDHLDTLVRARKAWATAEKRAEQRDRLADALRDIERVSDTETRPARPLSAALDEIGEIARAALAAADREAPDEETTDA